MSLFVALSGRRVVVTLALLFLTVPAWADTASDRATLKGITSVTAVVEEMDSEAERYGLTTSQLQTDVELRLRQAGIIVRPTLDGMLYVHVGLAKSKSGPLYAFHIRVQYRQRVFLARAPEIPAWATTWHVGGTGIIDTRRLREVRSHVIDLVDQFINAYLEQNPKQ